MTESVALRYLRLGLQLGRHVDGLVDGYFGPSQLAVEVDAGPPVEPALLARDAETLAEELDDGWLRDQVTGLRTCARALAGEPLSFSDEVEGCYGFRPELVDEAVFAAAHAELDTLLPGGGQLAGRYHRWQESTRVPAGEVERVVAAVIDEARAQTAGLFGLPAGEDVELELVDDVPWLAFCEYLGGLRSRISVNASLPISAIELLRLALHETYPGHHAERACKDDALVRGRGLLEETIVLVPTPQSLVSEGIATLAPAMLLEGGQAGAFATVLHGAGVDCDLPHAVAVDRAVGPLRWAEANAGLLLHERGVPAGKVRDYLERWALLTPELSAHVLRFLGEPTSRTYLVTYAAGGDLCRAYVGSRPERFRRLLTEQVRVAELVAASGRANICS